MPKYVALLRGINVGGKGIIMMSELKAAFEKLGYAGVSTFIQSGNVLFSSSKKQATLAREITAMLFAKFGVESKTVVLSASDLEVVVIKCPKGFGKDPARYRYDVIFFTEPHDLKKLLLTIPRKEGVDETFAGKHSLYFSRLTSKASQSRLSKIMSMPVYKSMTIRNWNTTTKLFNLLK